MDHLWDHQRELAVVLRALTQVKGLPAADVILGVPTGGQRIANELSARGFVSAPVVSLERITGGRRQEFRFCSEDDRKLALSASAPLIYEDVVSTLSSVAGVVRLLRPEYQDIHAVAVWRRGQVKKQYNNGVATHYLVEEVIPSFLPQDCSYPGCAKH